MISPVLAAGIAALCALGLATVMVADAYAVAPKSGLAPFTIAVAQHAESHHGAQYQLEFEPEQLARVNADVAARWRLPKLGPLLVRASADATGRFVSHRSGLDGGRRLAVEVYVPATAVDSVLHQLAVFWPERKNTDPTVVLKSTEENQSSAVRPMLRWTVEVLGERPVSRAAAEQMDAGADDRERVVALKLIHAEWAVVPKGPAPKISAWLRAAWTWRRDPRHPRLPCNVYWPPDRLTLWNTGRGRSGASVRATGIFHCQELREPIALSVAGVRAGDLMKVDTYQNVDVAVAADVPPGADFLVPVELPARRPKSVDEQHVILRLIAEIGRSSAIHKLELEQWRYGQPADRKENKAFAESLPLTALPSELQMALPALLPEGYSTVAMRGDSFAVRFAVVFPLGREGEALRNGQWGYGTMAVRAVGVAAGWLVLQFVAWHNQQSPPPPPDDPIWALANPSEWVGREINCSFRWAMDAATLADLHKKPEEFRCGQNLKVMVRANVPIEGPVHYRHLAGGLTVRVRLSAFRDDRFWGELNWPPE